MSRPQPIKYVYAVVGSEENSFAEMAAVSAATLRAVMPHAHIVILSDEKTAALKTPATEYLRKTASEWVVKTLDPNFRDVERSRHLTLSMRQIIDGHIVKLDVDTLIARDLSEIVNHEADFAAVANGLAGPFGALKELAEEKGWTYSRPYMNGGVWSARDTDATRDFFKKAHALWREAAVYGHYSDQLAINRALVVEQFPITWLPAKYNFFLFYLRQMVLNPYIYHVFSWDFDARDETVLHVLTKELKSTGVLNEKELAAFVASKNPWRRPFHPVLSKALGRPYTAVRRKFHELLPNWV